jgi:cation diffusion facilitator CzcD-associated flavoprotein CzcO
MDAHVTIVGAGPAGLALARELQRRGVRPALLERGRVGETWARQYEGLRLHSLASASHLPGMPWRDAERFPDARAMVAYLRAYAERFGLDVREGVRVERAEPATAAPAAGGTSRAAGDADQGAAPGWTLATDRGPWRTERRALATGIWSAPVAPPLPGREAYRGRALHVAEYQGPADVKGARVLVVGLGNSGKDVALHAARAAASVDVAVRDGAAFVPYPNALSQRSGELWRRLPPRLADAALRRVRREHTAGGLRWPARSPSQVYPVVGLELLDAVAAGRVRVRPGMTAFSEDGARFADGSEGAFDVIVLCTGYRPALDAVAAHVALSPGGDPVLDADGFRVEGAPGLYLIGQRYPTLETFLQRLRREAPRVARGIVADARRGAALSDRSPRT